MSVKSISVKLVNQTLLCALLFLMPVPALAINNYYISPSGSGTACSLASPCALTQVNATLAVGSAGTCTAASGWFSVAGVGACIHAASGTYTLSGLSPTLNKPGTASARIVFISDTKWGAKTNGAYWQVLASYIEIDGFDVTNPCSTCKGFNFTGGTGNRLQYNYLHDFSVNDCKGSPVNTRSTVDMLINGNIIRHAGAYGGPNNDAVCAHGIYEEGLRTVITNNVISGIAGWGIKSDLAAANQCGPRVIANNTIFNNGGGIDLTE
jgi:hypothetical protein